MHIKLGLGEGLYKGDQAASDTSFQYVDFELSYDEYVEIFSEFIRPRRARNYFDVLQKIFNNSFAFKNKGALSTFGIFKPKNGKTHTGFSMNFYPKDLRENPLHGGGVDVEQTLTLDLTSQASVLNQVGSMLTLGQEVGPPRSMLTWTLKEVHVRLGKVVGK